MRKNTVINNLQQYKKTLQQEGIEKLYLVGSFSRGEQTEKSDIDLIFTLSEQHKFGLFTLIKVKKFLEGKTGKSIDLVEEKSINKHLKSQLEKDKTVIF